MWAGRAVCAAQRRGCGRRTVFYEEDNVHECWDVPDNELVFRCVSAGDHQIAVTRDMLPSV